MKLTHDQTCQLTQVVCRLTDNGAEAFLFRLRLDDNARGGDVIPNQKN